MSRPSTGIQRFASLPEDRPMEWTSGDHHRAKSQLADYRRVARPNIGISRGTSLPALPTQPVIGMYRRSSSHGSRSNSTCSVHWSDSSYSVPWSESNRSIQWSDSDCQAHQETQSLPRDHKNGPERGASLPIMTNSPGVVSNESPDNGWRNISKPTAGVARGASLPTKLSKNSGMTRSVSFSQLPLPQSSLPGWKAIPKPRSCLKRGSSAPVISTAALNDAWENNYSGSTTTTEIVERVMRKPCLKVSASHLSATVDSSLSSHSKYVKPESGLTRSQSDGSRRRDKKKHRRGRSSRRRSRSRSRSRSRKPKYADDFSPYHYNSSVDVWTNQAGMQLPM